MKKIIRIVDLLSYIGGYVAGGVLLGITALTMVEVISRYVLHHPLILADEYGGYSLVIMSFLGFAYTWRERGHIRITLVVSHLPAKFSNWLRIITMVMALAYVSLATKVSYDFIADAFRRNIRSSSILMTPLKWPEMAIPIGFTLLAIVILIEIIRAIINMRAGAELERMNEETGSGAQL